MADYWDEFFDQEANTVKPAANEGPGEVVPESTLGGTFVRGLDAGMETVVADVDYAQGLVQQLVGFEDAAADNIAAGRQTAEQAGRGFEGTETTQEFFDNPTFSGLLNQSAKLSGQMTPYLISTVASGGTGAVLGGVAKAGLSGASRMAAKRVARDAVNRTAKGTATPDEKELAELVYQAHRKSTLSGAANSITAKRSILAGAGASEYTSMSGANFAENLEIDGLSKDDAALRAGAVAIPQALIGVGGEAAIAKTFLDRVGKVAKARGSDGSIFGNLAKEVGRGAIKSASVEGVTEVAQEGLQTAQRMQVDEEYTKEDALMRLGEAAFGGFIGGGSMGAAGGSLVSSASSVKSIMQQAGEFIESAREQRLDQDINREQYGDMNPFTTEKESKQTIDAQIAAMQDETTERDSVWIAGNTPEYDIPENGQVTTLDIDGEEHYAAFVPGRGTIISKFSDTVESVVQDNATDDVLQQVLGYSDGKVAGADVVIQVKDVNGRVVWEQATTEDNVSAAYAAGDRQVPKGGSIERKTVEQALEERKKLVDEEQGPNVRNIDMEDEDGEGVLAKFKREKYQQEEDQKLDENIEGRGITREDVFAAEQELREEFAILKEKANKLKREKRDAKTPGALVRADTKQKALAKQMKALKEQKQELDKLQRDYRFNTDDDKVEVDVDREFGPDSGFTVAEEGGFKNVVPETVTTTTGPDGKGKKTTRIKLDEDGNPVPFKYQRRKSRKKYPETQSIRGRFKQVFKDAYPEINFRFKQFADMPDSVLKKAVELQEESPDTLIRVVENEDGSFGIEQSALPPEMRSQPEIPRSGGIPQKPSELLVPTVAVRLKEELNKATKSVYAKFRAGKKGGRVLLKKGEQTTVRGPDSDKDIPVNLADLVKFGQRIQEGDTRGLFTQGGRMRAGRNGLMAVLSELTAQGYEVKIGGVTITTELLDNLARAKKKYGRDQAVAIKNGEDKPPEPAILTQFDRLATFSSGGKQTTLGKLLNVTASDALPKDKQYTFRVPGLVEFTGTKEEVNAYIEEYSDIFDDEDLANLTVSDSRFIDGEPRERVLVEGDLDAILDRNEDNQFQNEADQTLADDVKQEKNDVGLEEPGGEQRGRITRNEETGELEKQPFAGTNNTTAVKYGKRGKGEPEVAIGLEERKPNQGRQDDRSDQKFDKPEEGIKGTAETGPRLPPFSINKLKTTFAKIGMKIAEFEKTPEVSAANKLATKIANTAMRNLKLKNPVAIVSMQGLLDATPEQLAQVFADPNVAEYVAGQAQAMKKDKKKGRYVGFGDAHFVIVDNQTKNPVQLALTVVHELGHALFKEQLVALETNPTLNKRLVKAYKKALEDPKAPKSYKGEKGFEEWYADQVAIYAKNEYFKERVDSEKSRPRGESTAKEHRGIVQANIKALGKKLADMYKSLSKELQKRFGKDAYSPDFDAYIKDVVKANKENNQEALRDPFQAARFEVKVKVQEDAKAVEETRPAGLTPWLQKQIKDIIASDAFTPVYNLITTADSRLRKVAGSKVADMFYIRAQTGPQQGRALGMLKAATVAGNEWFTKLEEAVGDFDSPESDAAFEEAFSDTPTTELSGKSLAIRKWFESIHDDYIAPSNTDVKKRDNYTPVALKLSEVAERPEVLAKLILEADPEADKKKVDEAIATLVEYQEGILNGDPVVIKGIDPAKNIEKARLLTNKVDPKKLREAGLLETPQVATVQYLKHTTKRVEFNRHTKDERGFDTLKQEMDKLPPKQRAEAKMIVHTYLGYNTKPLSPFWRKVNSALTLINIVGILPLAVLGSIPELAGPVIASKEFGAITTAFKEIVNTIKNRDEAIRLTRDIGTVTSQSTSNIIMSQAESEWMTDGSRAATDTFFKVIGLDLFTRFTREFAGNMGVKFLEEHASPDTINPRSARYLKELGVTAEQVNDWVRGGKEFNTSEESVAVKQALQRFTETATLRPSSAERPIWASDPRYALIWQLKGFFYSYGKVILGGTTKEAGKRAVESGLSGGEVKVLAGLAGAGSVFALLGIATLPLAMMGMELREYTKWLAAAALPGFSPDDKDYFKTDSMDWGEYLMAAFSRGFAAGPATVVSQMMQAKEWGGGANGAIAAALGPTAEKANNIFFGSGLDSTIRNKTLPTGLL